MLKESKMQNLTCKTRMQSLFQFYSAMVFLPMDLNIQDIAWNSPHMVILCLQFGTMVAVVATQKLKMVNRLRFREVFNSSTFK